MRPNGTLNPRRLLVYSLWIIGFAALAAGAAAIAFNALLPGLTGFGEAWNFIVIGACLALYGLFVLRVARANPVDESQVRATIIFNALCLIPYASLVVLLWSTLTPLGMALLLIGAVYLLDGVMFLWLGLHLSRDAESARTGAGQPARR
ncbi:MAG TPA: hypothetical protein VJ924_05150 [Alphaproteobacteria bacterium]|nr:hypothetical protein [Alphaproteobacteria bacterium]